MMPYGDFEQGVRRAQLIAPWGIGAIVPFPGNKSMMIAGLDMWDYGDTEEHYRIDDERLVKRLGVQKLLEPPAEKRSGQYTGLSVPAVKFPLWHYCSKCGRMQLVSPGSNDQWCCGKAGKPHKPARMIPERFVAICPHGHIQDFPVLEWVHKGAELAPGYTHEITRFTSGSSTSLAAVKYTCSCGVSNNMKGATGVDALASIGMHCAGSRPWLGDHTSCDQELKVVQAGGTNVWFANVISSLWIPPTGGNIAIQEKIRKLVAELGSFPTDSSEKPEGALVEAFTRNFGITRQEFEKEYRIYLSSTIESGIDESISEEDYRLAEYEALVNEAGSDKSAFSCKRIPLEKYDTEFSKYFDGITLVRKLQETRAFVGFSRLEPSVNVKISDSLKELSVGGVSWAPAVKVFGEGIFFQFNKDHLTEWAKAKPVLARASILTDAYNIAADHWRREHARINPEFVLLHTFAHMVINRLSYDCGYGSSSIKERIYCDFPQLSGAEHDMAGVLIYTASGDSEGSMGGLVRMGEPGKLERVVWGALEDALWCSSDPVCSQSAGQGPDSCNLAACHNCALLPETCCENGNRVLDRTVVVGEGPAACGYFEID